MIRQSSVLLLALLLLSCGTVEEGERGSGIDPDPWLLQGKWKISILDVINDDTRDPPAGFWYEPASGPLFIDGTVLTLRDSTLVDDGTRVLATKEDCGRELFHGSDWRIVEFHSPSLVGGFWLVASRHARGKVIMWWSVIAERAKDGAVMMLRLAASKLDLNPMVKGIPMKLKLYIIHKRFSRTDRDEEVMSWIALGTLTRIK